MNTLALIQKKLKTQIKVNDYNRSIAYRGVEYDICHSDGEVHGSFCYRGRTYTR